MAENFRLPPSEASFFVSVMVATAELFMRAIKEIDGSQDSLCRSIKIDLGCDFGGHKRRVWFDLLITNWGWFVMLSVDISLT